jgi:hypothetical protein
METHREAGYRSWPLAGVAGVPQARNDFQWMWTRRARLAPALPQQRGAFLVPVCTLENKPGVAVAKVQCYTSAP